MIIPKIFHQIWFDFGEGIRLKKEHKQIMEVNRKYASINDGFEYKLWDLSVAHEFIEKHYPFYVSFMKKKWKYEIIKCDFFRYLLMYHFGGLYIDLDFMLMKPMEILFDKYKQYDIVLFEEWYKSINIENKESSEGSLHNGFLLSKPKNTFWLKMINKLTTSANDIVCKNDVWKLSGTNLLRNMYIKENDSMMTYLPYYKVCPFKCVSKEDSKHIIICDREENIPLSLEQSHWMFFNLNEVLNQKNDNMFDECYAVLISVGSLWNH